MTYFGPPDRITFLGDVWQVVHAARFERPIELEFDERALMNARGPTRWEHFEVVDRVLYWRSTRARALERVPWFARRRLGITLSRDGDITELCYRDHRIALDGELQLRRLGSTSEVFYADVILTFAAGTLVRAVWRIDGVEEARGRLAGVEVESDRRWDDDVLEDPVVEPAGDAQRFPPVPMRLQGALVVQTTDEGIIETIRRYRQLDTLEQLELRGSTISQLAPIVAACPQLTRLGLAHTQVRDLAPLVGLTRLRMLDVSDTDVETLAPLARASTLERLDLTNARRIRDLAPLSGLRLLRELHLDGTAITNLSPIGQLQLTTVTLPAHLARDRLRVFATMPGVGATTLSLAGDPITDLSPFLALRDRNLEHLDLSNTWVKDLAPLAGLTSLQRLDLSGTQVTDLAPLSALTQLQTLKLARTRVADLAPLARCTQLRSLDLAGTRVVDLAPLAALRRLGRLDITATQVTELAPICTLALVELYAARTPLARFAQLPDTLETLVAADTLITEIPELPYQLAHLDVAGTAVTALGSALACKLRVLDVSRTRIDRLELSDRWSGLTTLVLAGSRVSPVPPLHALKALATLDLGHLDIEDLSCIHRMDTVRSLGLTHLGITSFGAISHLMLHELDIRWARLASLAWLRPQTWTLQHLTMDADQAATLLDELPWRLHLTRITIEGRDGPDSVGEQAIEAARRFGSGRVDLLDA